MRSWISIIITPVFSVTWSSELILICWFAAPEADTFSHRHTVCILGRKMWLCWPWSSSIYGSAWGGFVRYATFKYSYIKESCWQREAEQSCYCPADSRTLSYLSWWKLLWEMWYLWDLTWGLLTVKDIVQHEMNSVPSFTPPQNLKLIWKTVIRVGKNMRVSVELSRITRAVSLPISSNY